MCSSWVNPKACAVNSTIIISELLSCAVLVFSVKQCRVAVVNIQIFLHCCVFILVRPL